MKTLKLLTITALVGTLAMSTLQAEERPHDRVDTKQELLSQYKDDKKPRVRVSKDKKVHAEAINKPHKILKKSQLLKHLKTLKQGDRGPEVKRLQRALKKERLYKGRIDGIFGKGVKRAVKKFQRKHHLHADGIAGAKTLKRLHIK